MISADLVGCSTARNKGTCENRKSVQRERLEARVLNALRYHLMDPALFREFCDEFTRGMNRLRMEGSASIETARSEIKRIERELDTLLNLILNAQLCYFLNDPFGGWVRHEPNPGREVPTRSKHVGIGNARD
ncbi:MULTISPECIES: hypothetical protein [Bradyrhizobium]|uniref:hypothetical protein n=1 Tax=Bradyrhizobium pachyrhizi TaxID=280333 RepID=UPI0004879732